MVGHVRVSRAVALLAILTALALGSAPASAAAGLIFTIGGTGVAGPVAEGIAATDTPLSLAAAVTAAPDGSLIVADDGRILRIDQRGLVTSVAGTGRAGFSGDGGPALAARIAATDVAARADGSVLVAECANHRVRLVAPDGTISTVAGSEVPSAGGAGGVVPFKGEGGPAVRASLLCPSDVAWLGDGSWLVADTDARRVLRVESDGTVHTVVGNGRDGTTVDLSARVLPGKSVRLAPTGLSVADDGSVLIADRDNSRVWRLSDHGTVTLAAGTGYEGLRDDDGLRATHAAVTPVAVAAQPDGGFLVADTGDRSLQGEEPRLRRVDPSGVIETIAGTGAYSVSPPTGLLHRGDGGDARAAELVSIRDVAALSDGGAVIVENTGPQYEGFEGGNPAPLGLLRYLAPEHPGRLAFALVRGRARIFATSPHTIWLTATSPASATVTAASARGPVGATTVQLQAGSNAISLPWTLPPVPVTLKVEATDAAGATAGDRATLLPTGWLDLSIGRALADSVVPSATGWRSWEGDPVLGCRQWSAARVDCSVTRNGARCQRAVTIRLSGRRLHWGAYDCPVRRNPTRFRRSVHPVTARELGCTLPETSCERLAGRLKASSLVPWG